MDMFRASVRVWLTWPANVKLKIAGPYLEG